MILSCGRMRRQAHTFSGEPKATAVEDRATPRTLRRLRCGHTPKIQIAGEAGGDDEAAARRHGYAPYRLRQGEVRDFLTAAQIVDQDLLARPGCRIATGAIDRQVVCGHRHVEGVELLPF